MGKYIQKFNIRHIATSYNGQIFAVAEFQRHVSIWNLKTGKKVSEFDSVLDFGGNRLAISEDGKFCSVGGYEKYGVALYSTHNVKLLWQREDITKVQNIVFDFYNNIIVSCDGKSTHVLNPKTYGTILLLEESNKIVPSPFEDIWFLEPSSKKPFLIVLNPKSLKVIAKIPRQSFGVLDAVFTEDSLVVSEAGGSVRAYSLSNGELIWDYRPPEGSHVVDLGYCNKTKEILANLFFFQKGGWNNLIFFSKKDGEIKDKITLSEGSFKMGFAFKGSYMIAADGNVYSIPDRKIVKKFDF